MTVNNLRKASTNDDVISLSKTLIKNWKKLLPAGDTISHVFLCVLVCVFFVCFSCCEFCFVFIWSFSVSWKQESENVDCVQMGVPREALAVSPPQPLCHAAAALRGWRKGRQGMGGTRSRPLATRMMMTRMTSHRTALLAFQVQMMLLD